MFPMLRVFNRCFKRDVSLGSNKWQTIRSFGKRVVKHNEPNVSKTVDKPDVRSLIKPLVFTVSFSGTVFSVYIVYNFEDSLSRHRLNRLTEWKQSLYSLNDIHIQKKASNLRDQLNQWWNSTDQSFKLFVAIAAINVMVFIGWKIPRLQHLMAKHFMCHSSQKQLKCWPMLWSTFSHYSATHLVFNMIVLHSFLRLGCHVFGCDQLLALYLSSGVISSFGSQVAKVLTGRTGSSLGASGAILGLLSSCCIARPDIELVIIFLPFFTISAGMALKSIILLDSAGLVLGWRFFDHGAHLAGALFGIWYTKFGQNIVAENRTHVINVWQRIRNKFI